MRIRRRLMQALLALSIGLIFVVQLDAHGGDPDLIHACINKDGVVRIVGPTDDCEESETARHWIRVRKGDKPSRERKLIPTNLTSLTLGCPPKRDCAATMKPRAGVAPGRLN